MVRSDVAEDFFPVNFPKRLNRGLVICVLPFVLYEVQDLVSEGQTISLMTIKFFWCKSKIKTLEGYKSLNPNTMYCILNKYQ